MEEPPTGDELRAAVAKLGHGKAPGESGILPEMVKAACRNDEFLSLLLDLVHNIWREGRVPGEWANALLIPIPKKGDLRKCDNWRGIAPLDVVGKVVAWILQARLQELAEDVISESQCGFRRECSCTDMIFTIRQMTEKSCEHKSKSFTTFIDFQKANDSIQRDPMWLVLKKLGVPETIVQLVSSFPTGMKVKICIEHENLEEVEVKKGLRQRCCMVPVLFNLYTNFLTCNLFYCSAGNPGWGRVMEWDLT